MMDSIAQQIGSNPEIELLVLYDNGRRTIGAKMNLLVGMAQGDYVCGVADDDWVEADYIKTISGAIHECAGVDVIAFNHEYYVDGEHRATIRESLGLDGYTNDWGRKDLTRHPSNKCVVRTELARQFTYPDKSDGEDAEFSRWLKLNAQTEHYINRSLYHYTYRGGNKAFRRGGCVAS